MTTRRFHILTFPVPPYHQIEREWRWAEQIGFDQAWIPETWTMSGRAYYEPWALLAALAHGTSSLRLGTLVAIPVSRHPTLLAGHTLAVDHISNGRVELGIGAGDEPNDSGVFGEPVWPARERIERLEDQLQLLDGLLRGQLVTGHGRHYSAAGAKLPAPRQLPRPPLVVAAEGAQSLRLVARHADAWVTLSGQPQTLQRGVPTVSEGDAVERTRERVRLFESSCREVGRDAHKIRRVVLAFRTRVDPLSSIDAFDEFVGTYGDLGFDEFVFYWPSVVAVFKDGREMSQTERATAERIAGNRFTRERVRDRVPS